MPLISYTIDQKFFLENDKIELDNLSVFNTDIEDLNLNHKLIFVENENLQIKEKIANEIDKISNQKIDNLLLQKKYILENILRNINQSLNYKTQSKEMSKLPVDFIKDIKNSFPRKLKNKITMGVFYPEDFEKSSRNFTRDFLGKLTMLIKVKSNSLNKIHKIIIYHKELAHYLIPNTNFRNSIIQNSIDYERKKLKSYHDRINFNKIKFGVDILFDWWNSLSANFKPKEFVIITDYPKIFTKDEKINMPNTELRFLEKKIEEFLFNRKSENFQSKVKIIKHTLIPSNQWWKHKRHWILTKKINKNHEKDEIDFFAIKSDFGVEIVNPKDNLKLSDEMELTTVDNKNTKHIRDITEYLFNDAQKGDI